MNKNQAVIRVLFLSFLGISSSMLMGSEEQHNYLVFNDASHPKLSRLYQLEKLITYDHKNFETAAELATYLVEHRRIDKGEAEYYAQNERFKDERSKTALLATGSSDLKYCVADPILGTGIDGKGKNVYGQILMLLRDKIKKEQLFTAPRAKL